MHPSLVPHNPPMPPQRSNFLAVGPTRRRSASPVSRSQSPATERIKKPKNPFIEIQNYLCKVFILNHLSAQGDKAVRTMFSDAVDLFVELKRFVSPPLFQLAKEEVLNERGLEAFGKINNNSQTWLNFQTDSESVYTSFHQTLGNLPKNHAITRLDRLWNETRVERKRNGIKNATQRCPDLLMPNDAKDPLCSTSENPVPVSGDGEVFLKNPRFLNSESDKPVVDKWSQVANRSRSPSPNPSAVRSASPNPSSQLFSKHLLSSKDTTVSEEVDVLKKQVHELSVAMDAVGGKQPAVVELLAIVEQLRAKNAELSRELHAVKAREAATAAQLSLVLKSSGRATPEASEEVKHVPGKLGLDVNVPPATSLESAVLGPGPQTLQRYTELVDS